VDQPERFEAEKPVRSGAAYRTAGECH
jgi:hypothetical protein